VTRRRKRGHQGDPTRSWPTKGKRPRSTAQERIDYAKARWEEDPNITINGKNGMNQRLMEVFGLCARAEQLMAVRSEVLAARAKAREVGTPVLTPQQREEFDAPRPTLCVVNGSKEDEMSDEKPTRTTPVVPAPGTTRSINDAKIRYDFARSYQQRNPGAPMRQIIDAVKDEFGIGIDNTAVGTIRRELGIGNIKRRRQESRRPHPPAPKPKPEPIARVEATPYPTDPGKVSVIRYSGPPEEVIKAAVQMLLEEVPGLQRLTLVVKDGKPKVTFEVAINRVESGEVEL
jgi:hypothetical protein